MEIQNLQTANISLLNIPKFIKEFNVQQVTSNFILEPSSDSYHPDGLFSEEIFGQLASDDRYYNFGYIDLNTKIFHPKVYKTVIKLKSYYKEILSGDMYAVFDEEEQDLVPAEPDDENAKTGFAFFVKMYPKIKFKKNTSLKRNDKINMLNKYKDTTFIDKYLVIPAGYRDFQINEYTYDEINKLYNTLINYARVLPRNNTANPMYDSIRYGVQRKVCEIFDYIKNLMDGKCGFMRDKYSKRKIALGTRNVISAANITDTSYNHPQHLKSDETFVPLFQCMKMFQPLVVFNLKTLFFNEIFNDSFGQTPLIDPKTYAIVYYDISTEEKNKFITSAGLKNMINRFRNLTNRMSPVSIYDNSGKRYLIHLIYDDNENIYMFRNKDDFKRMYEEKTNKQFSMKKVRPLTYTEMFYIATYLASWDKHTLITRYPVLGISSNYPSKVHVISTEPCKTVKFNNVLKLDRVETLPNYPVIGGNFIDSLMLHASKLKGLDGDFDGDTVSCNPVLGDEENKECADYLNSIANIVKPDGRLHAGLNTDICNLSAYNLSRF